MFLLCAWCTAIHTVSPILCFLYQSAMLSSCDLRSALRYYTTVVCLLSWFWLGAILWFCFFFSIKLEVQKWVANLTNSWYMLFLLQVDLTSVEGFDCRFAFRFRLIWVYWNLWTFILDVLVLWWKCTLISGKICVNWWLISKFIRNCSSDFRKADFPFAMYFVWLSLSCSLWDQLLFKVHFITFWFSIHFLNEICRMISLSIFT